MHSSQILCFVLVVACYVPARGYAMPGLAAGAAAAAGLGPGIFAPIPYGFGYEAPNDMGTHFRREQGDGIGNVQGSYGYTDNQGLYRQVDYVANAGGFHANVRTNEPGTDGEIHPADVSMMVQKPPAAVIQKYAFGGGLGGMAAGAGAMGAAGAGMMRFGFAGIPGKGGF